MTAESQTTPLARLRGTESEMLQRRAAPPDMAQAVDTALALALGTTPVDVARAGGVIAQAVTAHAAAAPEAGEPAYHSQYHQAEATLAMGLLCAEARRLGLLNAEHAAAGVLAMAGHDLQHDGSLPPPGTLEAHSAALTVALATQAGLSAAMCGHIHRVILATDPHRPETQCRQDDLLCHLAQEADLFASLTPELGWTLSGALEQEVRAARGAPQPPIDSFSGRMRWMRALRPFSVPAQALGLAASVEAQLAALQALGEGDAEAGAARLDALPKNQATAAYQAVLKAALQAVAS
jgi:hypothetical protein